MAPFSEEPWMGNDTARDAPQEILGPLVGTVVGCAPGTCHTCHCFSGRMREEQETGHSIQAQSAKPLINFTYLSLNLPCLGCIRDRNVGVLYQNVCAVFEHHGCPQHSPRQLQPPRGGLSSRCVGLFLTSTIKGIELFDISVLGVKISLLLLCAKTIFGMQPTPGSHPDAS